MRRASRSPSQLGTMAVLDIGRKQARGISLLPEVRTVQPEQRTVGASFARKTPRFSPHES
jgi:hypothetical protein